MPKPKKKATSSSDKLWKKQAQKISNDFIKAFEQDSNVLQETPASCLLTMSEVKDAADGVKQIYIIDPHQEYRKMILLDKDAEMLDDHENDYDIHGKRRIGHFTGAKFANSYPTDKLKWIVVSQRLSDYVLNRLEIKSKKKTAEHEKPLIKSKKRKAQSQMANVKKNLVKVASDFNALIERFQEDVPCPGDEDAWIMRKEGVIDTLNNVINKLEKTIDTNKTCKRAPRYA